MQFLIVEDDRKMAELLRKGLEEEGHGAIVASDGLKALEFVQSMAFDAVVLDVMLPGLDGFQLARRIRAAGNQVAILMLTGRDASHDVVRGLQSGADDYLTKPFSFDVLLARLAALTRRLATASSARLQVADLVIDLSAHEVRRGSRAVLLTRTEFSILECLIRNVGRVVPRNALIESVWGYERDIENNTLDVFIRNLRSKVDPDDQRRLIHTVRGVGYMLREGSPS